MSDWKQIWVRRVESVYTEADGFSHKAENELFGAAYEAELFDWENSFLDGAPLTNRWFEQAEKDLRLDIIYGWTW